MSRSSYSIEAFCRFDASAPTLELLHQVFTVLLLGNRDAVVALRCQAQAKLDAAHACPRTMFTIRLLACVCALRTARGGGGPGALSFQDAVSGAVEAEKEAAEIGKFKEETIKVDMVPDEMGMNPEGKAPLGLAFNIYHTQAYMFNEVAHWGQIGMYVVAKLWLGAGGGKLYPILGKVPPRSTLVEETPGALVFRRVYVQQVERLAEDDERRWAEAQADAL